MTSIEWLEKNIRLDMNSFELIKYFDQAKEMHKTEQETLYTEEQVLDAIDNAIKGYNHNTYTEKQLREAIEMSKDIKFIAYSIDDIINFQSLKQPKKD